MYVFKCYILKLKINILNELSETNPKHDFYQLVLTNNIKIGEKM